MNLSITLILVFSVLGMLDTLYLVAHTITRRPVRCLFFPQAWCDRVQFSKRSKTFGVPNSILGFILYAAIFGFALSTYAGSTPFLVVQTLITLGFLFALYFTYVQWFILRAFCTWCVVSALNLLILFIAAFFL